MAAAAASAMGMEGASQMSEEAIREAVLTETLARLLREKAGGAVPPWRQKATESSSADAESTQKAATPAANSATSIADPRLAAKATEEKAKKAEEEKAPAPKEEAPLDKFIKIFGLDELAATCLMKLQDDEAAFVIESCQHRLKHAKNPSATVMIAIKGVANKVGRRYYGSRETGEGGKAGEGPGELQMFLGSPASPEAKEEVEQAEAETEAVAASDPYLTSGGAEWIEVEEEEEEEEKAVDEEVDPVPRSTADAPPVKRARTELPPERLTVEVLPGTTVVEDAAEEDEDEPVGDGESLFFVDTGGV